MKLKKAERAAQTDFQLLTQQLELLYRKYRHVSYRPSAGDVFLEIPLPETKLRKRVGLSLDQAKFLLTHPERERDLLQDKVPDDWPRR